MLRPILAMAASAPTTRSLAAQAMIAEFNLSPEDQVALIPSGGSTYVRNRTGWAIRFLTKAGLIEKVAPKQYQATERGRESLLAHPELITQRDLSQLEGWREAWGAGSEVEDTAEVPDLEE